MIFDGPEALADQAQRYDICIAGGGVAGIVLARRLAGHGLRTLLLEGGGLEQTSASQSLYRGENVGHDYLELDACRLRFLGGTSNHWAGWCRPLDAEDFTARPQIADSGWPIGRSDLDPYLVEACEIMEIPVFPADRLLPGSGGRLREVARYRSAPVRFGQKYRGLIATSDRIHAVLNATLVDIRLDEGRGHVVHFIVAGTDAAGPRHHVVADRYVLALGGVENARTLLNADRQVEQGLGNAAGLVGRHFMDHPHFDIGYYVLGSAPTGFGGQERSLAPTHAAMAATGAAASYVQVKPALEREDPGTWRSGKDAVKRALCANEILEDFVRATGMADCTSQVGAGWLRVGAEQVPNPRSRVRLATVTDRFGLRRPEVDWQPLPMDLRTIRAAAMAIAEYFARQDIGRVKLFDWVLDRERTTLPGWETVDSIAGSHHMGTTRMGASSRDGVVDRECRMFGVDNLYVAGSSVFRTSGFANPTLTIVQLALRLADHLARSPGRGR